MDTKVKAARGRLAGVWTVGYAEDNCRERLVNDVYTLLSDHARLSAEVERLSTPGLPEPTDAEVREAIKTVSGVFAEIQHDIDRTNAMTDRPIEAIYVHVSGVDALVAGFRTLLRAVQSQRLHAQHQGVK